MTAARYKVPANFLRTAGGVFGLDLASLFSDEEEKKEGAEGFLPQFTQKAIQKGRGGVLGYQAFRTPTTVSTFELTPKEGATLEVTDKPALPAAAAPATTVKETELEKEPTPTRESLGSIAAKWGPTGLFGKQDYYKALEVGYKPEEIRTYIEQNPSMVGESNRPGQTSGLYEEIIRGQVSMPSEFFTPQQFLDRQISQASQAATQTTNQPTTQTTNQATTQTTNQPITQTPTQTTNQPKQQTTQVFSAPKASSVIQGGVGQGEANRLQNIAKEAGLSTKDVVAKAGVNNLNTAADVKKVLSFIESRAKK